MNREIELVSRYENVEGLVASAPVYIRGFKAGKVNEVVYQPETDDFKVVCSIRKEFRIPVDSRMTIYAVDIMGGKGVRIDLGSSEELVFDGGSLNPDFEKGLMDGLAAEITPLLAKVSSTLDSLGVTVSGVNKVLSDNNTAAISRTISHLEKTMADVKDLAAMVDGKSAELETFISNLAVLSDSFNGIATKVDTTVSGVNTFLATLNSSQLDEVLTSFEQLLDNINDPEGTVGKLLKDDSLYHSVDTLLNDVDTFIKKIQENPKKYIRISVF